VDQNGAAVHAVESRSDGERVVAREFGISWSDLAIYETQRQNSRAFSAYRSPTGQFLEIVSARRA